MRILLLLCSTFAAWLAAAEPANDPKPVEAVPQVTVEFQLIEITVVDPLPDVLIELLADSTGLKTEPPAGIIQLNPEGLDTRYMKILAETEKEAVLKTLMQQPGADLISAPKILTLHQQEATIEIGREIIWATALEVQAARPERKDSSGTNDWTIIGGMAVRPTDYTNRMAGVHCTVTPMVMFEKDTLGLAVSARVVEEPSWIKVKLPFAGAKGTSHHLAVLQPSFDVLGVDGRFHLKPTDEAMLCYAGRRTTSVEVASKVAVLGDIPLLGRLFTSRKTQVQHRMLLMLISASVVTP
ncbi:MAG: general secretion pathway protein D [Candidatus Omnitrophota bacterium]|jgi:general secretion pathway protein D